MRKGTLCHKNFLVLLIPSYSMIFELYKKPVCLYLRGKRAFKYCFFIGTDFNIIPVALFNCFPWKSFLIHVLREKEKAK